MAAEAAVSAAVRQLGDLLIQKVRFLRGVEGQVRLLKDELQRMQSFLKDANEKQGNDERIRTWISQIREVAHDAEDAIEIFVLSVENARRSRGLLGKLASFPIQVYSVDRVGKEIESIQKRLQQIENSRVVYGIKDLGDGMVSTGKSEVVERRRRLASWEKDQDVVGLEEDVRLLLQNAIFGEGEGLSIVTIVGMGGIGKSTLAKIVYNATASTDLFERRAWVVVSSEFTLEETIKQIILELQNSGEDRKMVLMDIKELEDSTKDKQFLQEKLQEMLHKQLEGKQYFVVLDDVWEATHWESLKRAFPNERDKISRLLLTSRNRIITTYAHYVHEMELLDPEKSWELFLKKSFVDNTNGECPEELVYVGRKILEKCGGLPLAISVVGGLLSKQKQSTTGWESVLNGINSHLGISGSSVLAILELSYQNLPSQLKSCFLCLGFFKEDQTILAKKLVQVWIAQSLVMQAEVGGEETLEDIASGYLDELTNRNMVQVKDMTKDGRIKSCQIHDLVRQLSINKAKEEINFEIIREEGNSESSNKARHRAMYCSNGRFIGFTDRNKKLHSLFVHGLVYDRPLSSYWKSFELLKVLDLEDCKFTELPDAIGGLIGLRYLGLRNTEIRKLPLSLRKLENLLILDLRNGRIAVPNFIWKMTSLRHLNSWEIFPKAPVKISSLENLQTLGELVLRDSIIKQLAQLTSLRKLGIILRGISNVSLLFSTLAEMEKLVRLNLVECRSLNMDGLCTLHRVTQLKLEDELNSMPTSFPPNLSYLTLNSTFLREDPMPVLEKLPKLVHLKLYYAYAGTEMVISHDGFPKLKRLSLKELPNLSNIYVGDGAMPELQRWEIFYQPNLQIENLPEHLRSAITYT